MSAGRPGWTRTGDPVLRGKGAPHVHDASRWRVEHCGHPTANWPYLLRHDDRPDRIVVSPSGFGFRRMADAQIAVERLHAGEALVVDVGWSSQYRAQVAQVREVPRERQTPRLPAIHAAEGERRDCQVCGGEHHRDVCNGAA